MTSWEKLKEKGNQEYKNKNYHTAIELYTDAISIDPEQDVLYANRSLCYKALENYRQSLNDLSKALSFNPKSVKNLKRKYEIQIILGNFPEAENSIQKCCNIEPREYSHKSDLTNVKNYIIQFNDFHEYYTKENYVKVEEIAEKLVKICTGNFEIKQAYLEVLISNNKLQEATSFWTQKLSQSERGSDEFIYLICKVFYYEGNYEKAKVSMKKLIQRCNDNKKYNKLLHIVNNIEKEKDAANNIFKAGKYKEAIEAYSKLLEIDPLNNIFNSTILANRGLCKKNNIFLIIKNYFINK